MTSVTIVPQITSIGALAFQNCSSLTNITIPNSVTSIGTAAFEVCRSLTSITIPSSVTSVGDYAFSGCTGLTNIICNTYISKFGLAFFGLNNVGLQITFDYVGAISEGACNGRTNLTSVTIGSRITSIGDYAFYGCTSLINIICNANLARFVYGFLGVNNVGLQITFDYVGAIPDSACNGRSKLKSVTIGSRITSIGNSAFKNCFSLTNITIPNSVTSIGESAVQSCSGLTSITIPNSVTTIGASAFQNCSGLTSITIPNSVTSIGPNGDEGYVFFNCSKLVSAILPANITYISGSMFTNCIKLESITIPNSVTSIGASAFQNCSSLTSVYFLGNIPTIANNNFTVTGDTAYYITGATNTSILTMFTTRSSLSLSQMNTLIGYIQPSPVITTITTSNRTMSINFTQLTNLEIPTITNYAYSTDGINYTDLTPAQTTSPLQITGLTNGQTYSFTIKAYNGEYSDASNSVSVTVPFPPSSAPVITSVSYSHPGSVKVNFTQINNSGAPITGYKYSLDGGQTYTAMNSVTTSPLTISGLKSGLTNSIVLKSNNGQDSIASNIFNFTHHVSKGKKKVLT
jgi:hypothetical protein